jgi:hypothetical protein
MPGVIVTTVQCQNCGTNSMQIVPYFNRDYRNAATTKPTQPDLISRCYTCGYRLKTTKSLALAKLWATYTPPKFFKYAVYDGTGGLPPWGGTITTFYPSGNGAPFAWTPTKIVIPPDIEGTVIAALGDSLFAVQLQITEMVLSDNIKTIGEGALSEVPITSIDLKNVETIYPDAFNNNPELAGTLLIPPSCALIWDNAFAGAGITTVSYANATHCYTREGAFSSCTNLTTLIYPQMLDEEDHSIIPIVQNTFSGSPLESITIGADIPISPVAGTMGINGNFKSDYDDNGRLAGTYGFWEGTWYMI